MNQSHRARAAPISSCHCCAPAIAFLAIEGRNGLLDKHLEKAICELAVFGRVGDKDFSGWHATVYPVRIAAP